MSLSLSIRSNGLPCEMLRQVKCSGRLRSLVGKMSGHSKGHVKQSGRLNYISGGTVWQFKLSGNSNYVTNQTVWKFKLSADLNCLEIQTSLQFILSVNLNCLSIQTVGQFKLSGNSICLTIFQFSNLNVVFYVYVSIETSPRDICIFTVL